MDPEGQQTYANGTVQKIHGLSVCVVAASLVTNHGCNAGGALAPQRPYTTATFRGTRKVDLEEDDLANRKRA